MPFLILIAVVVLLIFFPALRCALLHPLAVAWNALVDFVLYYVRKKGNLYPTGELVAYVGLFGKGKTLSAVHRVTRAYRRYDGKKVWCFRRKAMVTQRVKILSNVALTVPYEQLVSLEQVVRAAENVKEFDDAHGTLTITLVLGDEFSVQMNSRNFKNNIDALFLNTLLTCRHYHISLYYTAQRFCHVDALLRQVTSSVIVCAKLWRFQQLFTYDAWEMENAANPMLLRPRKRSCWFVRNRDYNAYDTFACVGNLKKSAKDGDMLTEEEILSLQCNQPLNMDAVVKPSRRFLRGQKKRGA